MKILLTGANGYIAMRLLPLLVEAGHEVTCVVRDRNRYQPTAGVLKKIQIIEFDFLKPEDIGNAFADKEFDVAYYFIHSLSDTHNSLFQFEKTCASCFINVAHITKVKQIIYLSGISNVDKLSTHLQGRKYVRDILVQSGIPYTIFEAGIVVGSGSASFEIICALVDKLPVMIAPNWLNTKCQPICIRNVIYYLKECMFNEKTYNRIFEIGGPDVLTYKEILLGYAAERGYKRWIFTFPLPLKKLSAFWINLITPANLTIAWKLVESMKNDVVCKDFSVREILPQQLIPYREAIQLAFQAISENMVVSSWKDAMSSSLEQFDINEHIQVPRNGCFKDRKWLEINENNIDEVCKRIFGIGGENGWYSADLLWRMRGLIDKMVGGVGLERGRRSAHELKTGESVDFWRVILADKVNHRLLLFAEMKLPGEAWLEFSILQNNQRCIVKQEATFRPHGLSGRLYWYSMLPFHFFIFKKMIKEIAGKN
jgi:uncharacterized protein YbjT (DUF2867 family)